MIELVAEFSRAFVSYETIESRERRPANLEILLVHIGGDLLLA
jgi:hypothetical protein